MWKCRSRPAQFRDPLTGEPMPRLTLVELSATVCVHDLEIWRIPSLPGLAVAQPLLVED